MNAHLRPATRIAAPPAAANNGPSPVQHLPAFTSLAGGESGQHGGQQGMGSSQCQMVLSCLCGGRGRRGGREQLEHQEEQQQEQEQQQLRGGCAEADEHDSEAAAVAVLQRSTPRGRTAREYAEGLDSL